MKKLRFLAVLLTAVFVMSLISGCSFSGGSDSGDIVMSESSVSLTVGSSVSLTASDSTGGSVSPLTWTSTDDNIVTVDDGVIKGKSAGSAVVKASAENGKSCSCNVTVTDKEITKLALDHQTASVEEGKTIQLSANFSPADATDTNLTWSSSDESVAVVNSDGYVTGVKDGVANISCKAPNGVEASCTVTVKGAASSSSAQSTSSSSNEAPRQPANNGGYYGHFAPSYVYNSADFVFPDSSVRRLTRGEISSVLNSMTGAPVSGSFAQDAVNEIYARNGYCFRDTGIRNYYEAQPWYYADESFTTSDFNDTENYNIKLLLEYT